MKCLNALNISFNSSFLQQHLFFLAITFLPSKFNLFYIILVLLMSASIDFFCFSSLFEDIFSRKSYFIVIVISFSPKELRLISFVPIWLLKYSFPANWKASLIFVPVLALTSKYGSEVYYNFSLILSSETYLSPLRSDLFPKRIRIAFYFLLFWQRSIHSLRLLKVFSPLIIAKLTGKIKHHKSDQSIFEIAWN